MSNTIGKKIRELRVIRSLSQDNIADEIGMSSGNYAKIERGEIEINSTHLIDLAKILKVKVGDFFEKEELHKNFINESKTDYGYATKAEVSDLAYAIIKLTKSIERIEEQLLSNTKKKNGKK